MLITRFFRKLSILKQADIFLPFKTEDEKLSYTFFQNDSIIKSSIKVSDEKRGCHMSG